MLFAHAQENLAVRASDSQVVHLQCHIEHPPDIWLLTVSLQSHQSRLALSFNFLGPFHSTL